MPQSNGKIGRVIEAVEITNFRGFKSLRVGPFAQFNVIVGDNAAGKTALLEAMFLALTSNPNKALLLRQFRSGSGLIVGARPEGVLDALYRDLFYEMNIDQPATIALAGPTYENRKLTISKGPANIVIKSSEEDQLDPDKREILSPINFVWTDEHGDEHVARTKATSEGIEFENAGTEVPTCFFYAAQTQVPSREAADRLSQMRIDGTFDPVRKSILSVFDQITDFSPEAANGPNEVYAAVPGIARMIPLASVSGGIHRAVAIATAIVARHNGIVFVDEMEQGIYYKRLAPLMRVCLRLAREYGTQVFVSTHSAEYLKAFLEGVGKETTDVAIWRIRRDKRGPKIQPISGDTVDAMLEYGEEPR